MLPVEAQTTALAPSSTALEIAIVMPRSLKEPVGLAPSTLSHTAAPTRSDSRGAGTSGVPPSSSVTTGVSSVMGRKSRYSSMTPRQPAVTGPLLVVGPLADDAEHAAHPVHGLVPAQLVDGGEQIPLAGHVGEEDQPGLVGQADLLHGPDRDVVVAEDVGHGGQHAGAVGHVHAEVEGRPQVVLRHDRGAGALRRRRGRAGQQVARGVDEVAEHGARGRPAAGAAPVEHELAAHRALDEDGVERAAHRGQGMGLRDHGRVDPDGDLRAAVDQLGHGQKLDGVAQPVGIGDVGGADRR